MKSILLLVCDVQNEQQLLKTMDIDFLANVPIKANDSPL
jgi:hypothetical protein